MTTPVHDWALPRLRALIAEAVGQGMDREVVVAVITDIITGPGFNDAVVTEADVPPPSGLSDPAQEPLADRPLPVTRAGWFPYAPSSLPDPE